MCAGQEFAASRKLRWCVCVFVGIVSVPWLRPYDHQILGFNPIGYSASALWFGDLEKNRAKPFLIAMGAPMGGNGFQWGEMGETN